MAAPALPQPVYAYLDLIFGDRPGYVALAFGRDPYRTAEGRYQHRDRAERQYPWPSGRNQVLADAASAISDGRVIDTYVCPAARVTSHRRKGGALPLVWLWADLDGAPADEVLLRRLEPLTVHSGQPGHRHIYVALAQPVDLATHARLNKALAARLGADAKWSDETLLRLPGTLNHKPARPVNGAAPQPPAPVVIEPGWSGRRWDIAEMAALLGMDLSAPDISVLAETVDGEQVDLTTLPATITGLLADESPADRSAATFALIGACRDANLTQAQAVHVVSNYSPAVDKYGPRVSGVAGEVARCWPKLLQPEIEAQMGDATVFALTQADVMLGLPLPAGGLARQTAGNPASTYPDDRFIDLRPFLTGTYTPPAPNVGARRNDGVQMLYPGRWHTVIGLTEAGKSLFAIWQAIETMQAGGVVVYLHFEEIGEHAAGGLIDRLRTFSQISELDNDTIASKFFPLSCERPWAAGELSAALARLPEAPALVVLDGINEAAGQLGGDVEKTTSITLYRKHLVTPATAVGDAVLSLGHPVKARSRQDERHSYGSTAWLDAVDGVSFRLESSSTPIAKGRKGSSALSVVKDRYGEVKRYGQLASNREAGWFYLGQFVVDDTQPLEMGTAAYLTAPKPRAEGPQSLLGDDDDEDGSDEPSPAASDDALILEHVGRLVAQQGRPVSGNEIESTHSGISNSRIRSALVRLDLSGRLLKMKVGRGYQYSPPTTSARGLEVVE
jgi:RepB DNA-primase from phage plasmid